MEVQVSSHDANIDEGYIGSATSLEVLDAPTGLAVDDYAEGEESQRDLRPISGDHSGAGVSVPDQSPPPAESANVPYSRSAPPNPTPGQTPVDPTVLKAYRRLHKLMLAPDIPPTYRDNFMQAGFRVDESGALVGVAGLILDSKRQPGIGATVPPRTHAQAWVRLDAAARGAFTRGELPVGPRPTENPPDERGPTTTTGAPVQGSTVPQNLGAPANPPTGTPSGSPNVWRGQIAYLLQQRVDQEPAPLHFSVIAAGVPNQNVETHRWPTRLTVTTGFKPLPLEMATQLYNSPIPFGQITTDQSHDHSGTDIQKWHVFQKIITAGWCIFYEFPSDSGSLHNPMQGSHGVLFFSTAQAPGRVLFKVFVNRLCPPAFTRGGQPAGPRLTKNPAYGGGQNGTARNPVAAATTAAGVNPGPGAAASVSGAEAVPSLNPGAAPSISPAGVPRPNTSAAIQAAIYRSLGRMAFARIGITPAQLAAMPPAQRQPILQQVRQMVLRMRSQQQQNMAAAGMAGA